MICQKKVVETEYNIGSTDTFSTLYTHNYALYVTISVVASISCCDFSFYVFVLNITVIEYLQYFILSYLSSNIFGN